MRKRDASPDAEHARERIGEILSSALGTPDAEALEDETRRLMLHLSIEPLANAAPLPQDATPPAPARKPLLRRLLRKPDGDPSA